MAKSRKSEYLPQDYISRHDLLLYYNDLIVDMLELADKHELSHVEIKHDNKEHGLDKINNEKILDWLFTNGFEGEASAIAKSHIFFSLLTDFIYYMHESFDCSERGKVTVAFTLCRKPIKDNLFYFCWLLVDEKDFIDCMMNKEPKEYDVTLMNVDKKKKIINKASTIVSDKHEEDLLFNIIYKRNSLYGLSSVWDQSIHLVTGNKNYPTEQGNLNFIFATDEIWNEFWELYYEKIPYIMNFAMEVIISIFESILKPNQDAIILNRAFRKMKLCKTYLNDLDVEPFLDAIKFIEMECESCDQEYKLSDDSGKEFVNDYLYTCPYCGVEERVGKYFLDSNFIHQK